MQFHPRGAKQKSARVDNRPRKNHAKNRFLCRKCGASVPLRAPGTRNRNHCPYCLYSRHVDITRGDRKSRCGGMMKPIGIVTREDGEILLLHQCQGCGHISKNRVAGDDNEALIAELKKSEVGDRLV